MSPVPAQKQGNVEATLSHQFAEAFIKYARDGIACFENEHPEKPLPHVSHICFKFTGTVSYRAYVEAARALGTVKQQMFKGKEISWCKLNEPLHDGDLAVEWVELVEPHTEKNGFDGVTSLGYYVPGLNETIKIPVTGASVIYRYQSQHAAELAKG